MGMGELTSWPACNRVIREWFPASERGFANAVFGAGAAAGPAIGAVVCLGHCGLAWLARRFLRAGCIGFVWLAAWLFAFDKPERVRLAASSRARQDPAPNVTAAAPARRNARRRRCGIC